MVVTSKLSGPIQVPRRRFDTSAISISRIDSSPLRALYGGVRQISFTLSTKS